MRSTTERRLTWAVFLGAACGVLYLCLLTLRPFANVIAWSVVLAIVCYPVHERLVRRTHRVALSALITSVLTVVAFIVPLLLIGAVAVTECVALGQSLRGAFQSPDQPFTRIAALLASVTSRVGVDQDTIVAWVQQHGGEWAGSVGHYTMSVAAGLVATVVSWFFVIFALFLILRDCANIVAAITGFLPFERRRSERLLRRIKEVVQASVYGVVVIALMQGALCGAMFALLGIPAPALWGTVTVFASVLPVFGAFAVWGPGTLYLAMTGHWVQTIVMALWGTFVVSGIDNVLRPRLVAGRAGLSELTMFFALLGGMAVFGALGVVLGPVSFATLDAIVDTLREPAPAAASAVSGNSELSA